MAGLGRGKGVRRVLLSLLVVGMTFTGCGISPELAAPAPDSTASATPTSAPTTKAPVTPAGIKLSVEDAATFVNPGMEVTALITNGTVKSAALTETASGKAVKGEDVVSGKKWINREPLKFETAYNFTVTAEDAGGATTTKTVNFTTVPLSHEADAVLYPAADSTVGVAQPLQFVFSEPVVNKEAVEKAITISNSKVAHKGAFRWYSDTMLRYRSAEYWPAHSTITVDMQLFGMDLGNGMIGNFDKTYNINVADKIVMEADAGAHNVKIYVNDVLAQDLPATLGDADFPSASGYMVLTNDKQRYATFKASTIGLKPGDPGDYGSVDVEYATRLSYSGIFIHQATPSAMPFIGAANLSHGCIGLSPAGAGWVYNNMRSGDIVHTVNTPNETIAPTDGFGDWNIPFEQYAAR